MRSSPRQEYAGWIYPIRSQSCRKEVIDNHARFTCNDEGVYSSILVLNHTNEMKIGWGRGFPEEEKGEEREERLPSNFILISEAIASSLELHNGEEVFVKIELE